MLKYKCITIVFKYHNRKSQFILECIRIKLNIVVSFDASFTALILAVLFRVKKENNENDSVFQLNNQQEITQCFGCEVNQTLSCCHFSISCQKVLIGYMFSAQHLSEHIEYTPYYYEFCFWQ